MSTENVYKKGKVVNFNKKCILNKAYNFLENLE